MVGMLVMEAGEKGRVKSKEKMGDGRAEVEGKRKRGGGSGEAGRDWGEREKTPKSLSIWSPDMNQDPALQWNPMQQLKSMLSIYTYWQGETSAVYG